MTYTETDPVFLSAASFHPETTVDEAELLGLLSVSLALTISEKKKILNSLSILKQFQIDELRRIFIGEQHDWANMIPQKLPASNLYMLQNLRDKAKAEWEALRQGLLAEQASRDDGEATSDFGPLPTRTVAEIRDFLVPHNRELVKQLAQRPTDMYVLSPRQFEILVAEIVADLGWEVELTPESNDGGRDIIATIQFGTSRLLAVIECKKYSPKNKVGIEIVERFVHTVRDKDRASFGMLATSSYFTQGAWDVAQSHQWQLQLNDYDRLCHLLKNYGRYTQDAKTGLWVMPKA